MDACETLSMDGSPLEICLGKTINRVVYHEKLNVIFIGTSCREIFVVDPTLGDILYTTTLGVPGEATNGDEQESQWDFDVGPEKFVVVDRNKVGIRSEYNGILLLGSILQTPVRSTSDVVQIELNKSEAESLCHSLAAVDAANEPDSDEVEKLLKLIVNKDSDTSSPLFSVKKEKWSTVKLELRHSTLKSTFQSMVNELWKKNAYIPQLSIASSILERLNMLHPPGKIDSDLPLDKTQMFSESARLNTFTNWPHMDYKWALPEKMAQAGFYHNPSTNGDDRAMCFTCNVCLVSWEPTDEPWSEHERHSPFCPFVRGEHTHNVPLCLSYATSPAFSIKKATNLNPLLGKSSCPNAAVVGFPNGLVVVWDTAKVPKEVVDFEVTPKDLTSSEPLNNTKYCDIDLKPKETSWVMDTSDTISATGAMIATVEMSVNVNTDEKINLTAVSTLGMPTTLPETYKLCPPSVVVAGTLFKSQKCIKPKADPYCSSQPFLLLFGLSSTAISTEDSAKNTEEVFKAAGSTGTKQESQTYEDDIFGSYISEGDMLSDSVSIFSDMNMSDSSSTFVLDPISVSGGVVVPSVKKKIVPSTKKSENASKAKSSVVKAPPNVVLAQKLNFPPDVLHCDVVHDLIPTGDGAKLIVIVERNNEMQPQTASKVCGAMIAYNVVVENNIVLLSRQCSVMKKITEAQELITNCCLIPPEVNEASLACVLRCGDVSIFSVNELTFMFKVRRPNNDVRITSVSYCGSFERLCCGTSSGTLEFYALNGQSETEFIENDTTVSTSEKSGASTSKSEEKKKNLGVDDSNLNVNQPLTLASMKQLLQLTSFENIKPCFSANVPSCWVKIIQAQKERKHPQHLQHHDSEISVTTLSWRLQRTKNSKKEHLFEITLPKSSFVGHLDLKFLLQMSCGSLPTIEITLYRATKSKGRNGSADVDRAIDFGSQLKMKTPSNEFLKSINAEIVCGPLDLGSHIDLSAQGGNVVMTSPLLMLDKGRNFYLHIKAKTIGKNDATGSPTLKSPKEKTDVSSNKPKSSSSAFKLNTQKMKDDTLFYGTVYNSHLSNLYPAHHKLMESPQADTEKRKDYGGCDWLHEVSITIRQIKPTNLPNEEYERRAMLTSSGFMEKLLDTAVFEGKENTYAAQNAALDLLVWIAAVNLCGPQVGSSNYQMIFTRAIQTKLDSLILHGILFADRSTAHKCAKLFVLCIDAVETYHTKEEGEPFLMSILNSLLSLLPFTISCVSAGSLQWFFLLLNRVRGENLGLASESLLNLLKEVSNELNKRADPMHALLRTRFGLYGTPFEPELFEIELPPVTKSYSHPLTYAGMCGGDNPSASIGSGTFHLWGLKDVDFRDLLVGNPLNIRLGKIGILSPKQQIQGLLEVEPLHFTCHAASDGTRIEKIDLGVSASSFAAVPLPQPWEPFTNMPTGEGSKKSEPDKVEQIMMLQKALKMESNDAYYDVLSDLKFMESNVNVIELPYPTPADAALAQISHMPMDPNWKNVGVLTMVMPPSGNPSPAPGPSSKLLYGPFIQPSMSHLSIPLVPNCPQPQQATSKALIGLNALMDAGHNKPSTSAAHTATSEPGKVENDGLRLLLSPWQQMMYVPPQQALVIDRMHSGARRFVVLDFGAPILLTDMVIPACNDLVSLSIDIWLHREETDGQRLVVASDIGIRSLVICDLQPPPICRYLKITTIGRYGMGTTKCRIPVGMFYGHTTVLPNDLRTIGSSLPNEVTVLSPTNIQTHLSVLSYLVEDIGCRYQLACAKLRRLLEPLMKPELSSLDHISYYLPKGRERSKLGFNTISDQSIIGAYQDCITLQQQLNVAKNVVKRLQKSLSPFPNRNMSSNMSAQLTEICTDKVHLLSEFLIESLLGISFLALSNPPPIPTPYSLYSNMNKNMCEALFRDICVLENGQCQLSTCTLMLRACGFQPWWGKFLASTLKNLFSSLNSSLFPQDRVFILLVYLGQKALLSGQNSSVLESAMELLSEILAPIEDSSGFLRSKVDMTLLGWIVMYLCLCLDGVNCTLVSNNSDTSVNGSSMTANGNRKSRDKDTKEAVCISSRWDFIQGESALYRRISGPNKTVGSGGFKRRIQKKILATKQKLEELDGVAAGLGYTNQMQTVGGLGTQLSALGNKIEAIKQKQANIGKSLKMQSSKVCENFKSHFKDLLQIRRSEMLYKRGILCGKEGKEDCVPSVDVEINLNLNPSLCLTVAKRLALLLLRMDSTCHSDVYLIACKTLARISTACRPAITIGSIFTSDQLIGLIISAVGSDYVRQRNWSSSWISHAIMCLIQDILEGERLFPSKSEDRLNEASSLSEDIMSGVDEASNNIQIPVEEIIMDEVDSVNDMIGSMSGSSRIEVMDSEDSDYDEVIGDFSFNPTENRHSCSNLKKSGSLKKLTPCVTSISTALDARLESGVESTTELRLRMMAVVDSEVLTQSLKAPIEVPSEIMKNISSAKASPSEENISPSTVNSCQLLASCFDKIFLMMSSENCSVSIEKVLQLWISINMDIPGTDDIHTIKPAVPLSCDSITSLMMALTKNTGIGVQEWGLAFQCLSLAANQRTLNSTTGQWLYIMIDKHFPEMILKFISGSGMNLQKNNIVSAGPTVCQHFYNFLLRLRQLSNDTPWTPCLKEILLRVLSLFLSGPFLNSDFPLDAFNKFLDRVTCPDLSYESPSTVIQIIEQFAQILHLFVFFPNKITIRSVGDMKALPTTSTTTNGVNNDAKLGKTQNFEHVIFRLVSFMASFVSLPYKTAVTSDSEVHEFLAQMPITSHLKDYGNIVTEYVSKCDVAPKTIADIVLQMESTMMRILSVLANPNGINVLVSGDLLSAFNIMETSTPTTVVDSVIHLFSKLCNSASHPQWTIKPLFRFLSKSPYDDFYCPLIVSETFVLMVLKVISKEEHLKEFTELKCVESICEKLVSSTKKFFSSCPTFVSILTQYIGRSEANAMFGQKKFGNETIESADGLINVAPLGTITSTNFSAHPSEVLLQATPPHRRARTPVWSYHFFPEEAFLELIVTLPCAILLKEVQIVPHMTSLSTACPSAIMVEVSRDRSNLTLPMGPPVYCGGMSCINIQLTQPEVAQTVLLRLFKPKDSNNLGLSQIRLLGCTTFSEAALQGLSPADNVKSLESSAHWMYILDRAMSVSDGDEALHHHIIETAVNIPDMLESCYSMLVAPVVSGKAQEVYLPHVSSVLFQFGSHRKDVGEQLMMALLGPVQMGFSHGMVANSNPHFSGGLSQLNTVVELVFNLCCNIPDWGYSNLVTVVKWLESCADRSISSENGTSVNGIVPEYVQSVAAALWSIAAIGKTDLSDIATPNLLRKLYDWSLLLDPKTELKATLDHVMCAVCFSKPWLFLYLMHCIGIIKPMDWIELDQPIEELLFMWYDEGSTWDRIQIKDLTSLKEVLNVGVLMTLGRASQSATSSNMLQASQFLVNLNAAIMEFWNHYTNKWVVPETDPHLLSTQLLVGILMFYTELCGVNDFKTWFGSHGSGFWLPILNLLSTLTGSLKSAFFGSNVYDLESVVIGFLSRCCWSHPENQKIIASCLREIILQQKATPHKAVFLHSMSSFCRRLLIQLLLDNEKVIVHVKSSSKYPLKTPMSTLPLKNKHPSMGVNGGDRIFYMSTHAYSYELMKLIEPFGVSLEKMATISSDPNRFVTMLKREQGLIEAGLEMIDQMQLAMSGNAAKDKRAIAEIKRPIKTASKKLKPDGLVDIKNGNSDHDKSKGPTLVLEPEEFPDVKVPPNVPLATIMSAVRHQNPDAFLDILVFTMRTEVSSPTSTNVSPSASTSNFTSAAESETPRLSSREGARKDSLPEVFDIQPLPSTIEVFSRTGGLGLLAKHLPVVYPETLRQIVVGSKFTGTVGVVMNFEKDSPIAVADHDWVKIESADDFYDDMMESMVATSTPVPKRSAASLRQFNPTQGIPPHSMAAFGLFLSLPRFSEVLLSERVGAQCMLRLVMGVTDDADGNDIFNSAVAKTLPTLPFQVLRCLLDVLPLNSEEGRSLRRAMVDVKATHFILACLAVFTHQTCDPSLIPGLQHELVIAATKAQGGYHEKGGKSDDKSHVYWAKGTGFGTGSTAQSWDVEMAMQKKKAEEENVTCLLHVLSSFIHPRASHDDERDLESEIASQGRSQEESSNMLPTEMTELLKNSCLFPAIAGYLRNDSVLDMARHVPLYKSVLQFLRSLVSSAQLLPLLAPWEKRSNAGADEQPISYLLSKMKEVVDNYAKRLTTNSKGTKPSKTKSPGKTYEDLEDEGLALLIPDIQTTAINVENAVNKLITKQGPFDVEMGEDSFQSLVPVQKTLEERYLDEMKKLQFAFFEMITEDEDGGGIRFSVSYHYEGNVRTNWARSFPARLKRLAQESVTLSTSLPIAYGSTIFVRCDNDRLDVMKVLITGPAATPYANGCFEFDVFFPNDYPNSPMMINLETTGRQRVRFNPNLYTDGKVCLSILNTWHGRPEEKWNPQTSSLLPVLVAIQSLILNAEPYFNEPGYEKSRGTDAGERNSREYNAGIEIATVEWAMLDQIRHPSACFKEIIHKHFWLKRAEIIAQCEKWLEDLVVTCRSDKKAGKNVTGGADPVTVFKNNLALLKKEFVNMKPPPDLEDLIDLYPTKSDEGTHCSSGSSDDVAGSSESKSDLSGQKLRMNMDEDDDEDEKMLVDM